MQINDAASPAESKMELNDPIATVMSRSVVVATLSQKFSDVLAFFSQYNMHHLPIVDSDNRLIGIISTNDILKIFTDAKFKGLRLDDELDKAISLSDIMTSGAVTVSPQDTISQAAKIFAEKKFLAMPVVENGKIVGILSVKDLVEGLAYFS